MDHHGLRAPPVTGSLDPPPRRRGLVLLFFLFVAVIVLLSSTSRSESVQLLYPETLHMLRRPGSTEHIETRSDTYVL